MADEAVNGGAGTEAKKVPPAPPTPPPPAATGVPKAPVPKATSSITLAENLERTDRHPVLIFGSSQSGKSSLILSLIRALQTTRDVDVAFGEPVFDRADPVSKARHAFARRFYDWQNYKVDQGQRLDTTQTEPFFVPIDVKPRNSMLPPVKLAFLDSRGGGYEPNFDEHTDFYKQFSPEVINLLQTFSYGITIICIAPYSVGMSHDRDTRNSSFGLLGALGSYRELRKMRKNDFHLLLLTKWDQFASPMDSNGLFDQVEPRDVDAVLRDRYNLSWGDFQALPLEGEARERRAFMQYCSGYFVDGEPHSPPANFERSFMRYPRTVLNWLYGNATQFKLSTDEAPYTLRKILFDDVIPASTPRISITDRLAAILTSR